MKAAVIFGRSLTRGRIPACRSSRRLLPQQRGFDDSANHANADPPFLVNALLSAPSEIPGNTGCRQYAGYYRDRAVLHAKREREQSSRAGNVAIWGKFRDRRCRRTASSCVRWQPRLDLPLQFIETFYFYRYKSLTRGDFPRKVIPLRENLASMMLDRANSRFQNLFREAILSGSNSISNSRR